MENAEAKIMIRFGTGQQKTGWTIDRKSKAWVLQRAAILSS